MNQQHLKQAVEFGRQLLLTEDLDPVYVAIYKAGLSWNQRARLVLAYSCLYHLGASAYLSDLVGERFWRVLATAAQNKSHWPRGTERRHWRGHAATGSIIWLRHQFKQPEDVIEWWLQAPQEFLAVTIRVKQVPSYGPWIAFKIADLAERILEYKVDFSNCSLEFYKEPRCGAELLFPNDSDAVSKAVNVILKKLPQVLAPPSYNRWLNIQEAETILCKYKAFVNKRYWIGKDIHEVRHGLKEPWGPTAQKLLKHMPPEVPHDSH